MKRGIWQLSMLAVAVMVGLLAGSTAEAACSSAVTFNTGIYPNQNYVYAPAGASSDSDGSLHAGAFWEPGKRASQGCGVAGDGCAYDVSLWWKRFGTYPFYLDGNLTVPEVSGCPGGPTEFGGDPGAEEMIILLLDSQVDGSETYYYVARPDFDLAAGTQYDMGKTSPSGTWGNFNMQPLPKVNVQDSVRVGDIVNLTATFDDVAAAFQDGDVGKSPYDTISEHEICTQVQPNSTIPSAGFPGRNVSDGWDCGASSLSTPSSVPTAPGGAAAVLAISIPDANSFVYVASRVVLDGGEEGGSLVSAHTIVEGDPTLAQPEPIKEPVRRPAVDVPSRRPKAGKKPKR